MSQEFKTVFCPVEDDKIHSMHPRVYIKLDSKTPKANCPYCQKEFSIEK